MASEIEESDIDWIGVIACDGEVNSGSRIFIYYSKGTEIGNICRVHEGHPGSEAPMSRNSQDCILDIRIGLGTPELFDILHDHAHKLFQGKSILSLGEVVSAILEPISLKGSTIERFDEFVQVEVGGFGLLQTLGIGIILEVTHSIQEADLLITMLTPLWLLRDEREFSTITRFLPGEIREAFQNSVPRSIPMTCDAA